jgi:hypothetical protein
MHHATATYTPVDPFFGTPFIDVAEDREDRVAHRYVHGGFRGTATRFSFYFPDRCGARFFRYFEGGYGGTEHAPGLRANVLLGLQFAASRGGFLVESNQGHDGAEVCSKGGDDVSIYAYRASAETARFARHLAISVYGAAPKHGYAFGLSGGGRRALSAMERCEDDVWDGGVVGAIDGADSVRVYSVINNAHRVVGSAFDYVVDAMEPAGWGDPFAHLDSDQREALADLYESGFPRGAERSVTDGLNAGAFFWSWNADVLIERQRDYFASFWSQPVHAGADGRLDGRVLTTKTVVIRTVTAQEALGLGLSGFSGRHLAN